MADNVAITPGSGVTVRAKDRGDGFERQVVMLDTGSGSESLLAFGQAMKSASLPVTLASDQGALSVTGTFWQATQPVSGTVTANAGTNLNTSALALESGGNLAAIGTATGTTADTAWTGTGGTTVIGGLKSIYNAITNNSLPAGTNTIGAVTGASGVALARDSSVTGLQVAQGSTTSGQSGSLTLGAVTTAAPSYTTAQSSPLSLTTVGALRVDASATTQPVSGTVSITTGGQVTPLPSTTAAGHSTTFTALSLGATTVVSVKASAGNIGAISLRNNSAATRYLKLYNLATGSVTPGTTSAQLNIGVAAGATRDITFPFGLRFATAISYYVSTGQSLTDNTAGSAGDMEINVVYL